MLQSAHKAAATLAALISVYSFSIALAEAPRFSGHAKTQLTHGETREGGFQDVVGPDTTTTESTELRFNSEFKHEKFDLDAAYEMNSLSGDTVPTLRALNSFAPGGIESSILPNDERRLFDLTIESNPEENLTLVNRTDRLSVGYVGDRLAARLGRQAVSWGNGLLFQVLDPFNPFSPTAIDKDYKTGDDSAYSQWLFDSGDDLQVFIVPRRNTDSHDIAADQSSFAAKWRGHAPFDFQYDLLGAAHYGEQLWGVGLTRDVMEAVARVDVSLYRKDEGDEELSLLANIDRTWEFFGKNIYLFVEYFHSGVGVDPSNYATPDKDLSERVARGELFTLGRDYIGSGARLELTPLFNLYSNAIFNLHDQSDYLQFRVQYELLQDLVILAGINLPIGGKGSEYGGVEGYSPEGAVLLSRSTDLYVRISWYFG